MGNKTAAIFSLIIILSFMGYIIYDASRGSAKPETDEVKSYHNYEADWEVKATYSVNEGSLSSVAVDENGTVFIGGGSFVKALNEDFIELWSFETEKKITALAVSGDTVFAATAETILLISASGKLTGEWGPYEENSLITSVEATPANLVFADAGNKRVFVLDREGEVKSMIGQGNQKFIVPSPYFDAAISGKLVYVANTGMRRIETWNIEGSKITEFGEAGTAPEAFCGCCNPAHFAIIPQGFITAEKGINRIKIMDLDGHFREFVSVKNDFNHSVPVDVASADGTKIYAANSDDNNLYLFTRK